MKCDLKITSEFSGENSRVEGTIEHNGELLTLEATGSASERGTRATITHENGSKEEQWWCGVGHPGTEGGELESVVDGIFEECYDKANEVGDVDDNWFAKYVDGKVVSLEFTTECDFCGETEKVCSCLDCSQNTCEDCGTCTSAGVMCPDCYTEEEE